MSVNYKRALRDTRYYIENCLWIKTKMERLVPLVLNNPQRKVIQVLTSLKESGLPVRIICLKARQMGMSTLFGALLFQKTATKPYVTSAVAAHKDKPSVALFDMYKLFYRKLPPVLMPMTTYSSRRELVFENPHPDPMMLGKDLGLMSKLTVHTAGGVDFARSPTIHNFHWSEVAFTANAADVHVMVGAAIPDPPAPSQIFYESTANGPSGLFHDLFWDAWNNKNDWTPVFLAWHEMEEYRMPLTPGFALSDEEVKIKTRYKLDNEQLAWRRYIIRNKCLGDMTKFMQEWPACPEEAFLSSIKCVFDMDALVDMEAFLRPVLAKAEPTEDGLTQSLSGKIKVWEWPDPNAQYLIGIDPAGGREGGNDMVAQVTKRQEDELVQVAKYVDHLHPAQFTVNCIRLGKAYNNAYMVPERNYHGVAVIAILEERRYWNVFKDVKDTDNDYGVHVGPVNKYYLVDRLSQYVYRRKLIIRDEQTLRALKSYQEEGGRFHGKDDDHVDALRLVTYAAPYTPRQRKSVRDQTHQQWDGMSNEKWDDYIQGCIERRM